MDKEKVQKLFDLQMDGYQILYSGHVYDCYAKEDDYEAFTCPHWGEASVQCHIEKHEYDEGFDFVFIFELGGYSKSVNYINIASSDVFARKITVDYIRDTED